MRAALEEKTQEQLAEQLGTTQQTVSRIKRGELVPRSFDLVDALRRELGIAPEDWKTLVEDDASAEAA